MTRTMIRLGGFLLAALALVAGVLLDRVIEAAALAAVLVALSIWVQRLLAAPEDRPDDAARDWM
jgi:hypothetical protein